MVATRRKLVLLLALISGLSLGVLAAPARAAEATPTDTSLRWVPEDAAFYASMTRNKEQLDILLKSKAWARLTDLPLVKMGWQMLQRQLDTDPKMAEFKQIVDRPENQQLVALLGDMASQEIFCYGGGNIGNVVELLMNAANATRFAPLQALLGGNAQDAQKLQIRAALQVLADNPNSIQVPDLIIGFKVSDTNRAETQLERLQALLDLAAVESPPLKDRLKKVKIGKGSFLTLTLDGKMIPWDQLQLKDIEEKEGQFDKLVDKLKNVKLVVGIGVHEGYLMLAIGGSTDVVAKLGKGKSLVERPEFKPFKQFADKRLTSVSYVSKALLARLGTSKKDIDDLISKAKVYLPLIGLTGEKQTKVNKDLDALAADIKKFIGEPGASVGFSFLTDRGSESYSYNYAETTGADGSKPLTLLNHVGGDPICALVGRSKYSPEIYQMLVKWIKTFHSYFEELALPHLNEQDKEKYETFTKIFFPLLKRLDQATGKLLLPALADGQSGVVLDGKIASKKWVKMMPPSEQPMPMLELAIVAGVSDADKLKKAFGEYRSIINDAIAKAREFSPMVPAIEVPEPDTKPLKNGTLYFYPLPEFLGIDAQLLPNGGLSDKVAVLSTSPKQTERVLAKNPLKTNGGPLANLDRPLVAATYLNFPALVDTLSPWLDFGMNFALASRRAAAGGGDEGKDDPAAKQQLEMISKTVKDVLEIAKCLRRSTSVTYIEDGVLVTHSETVYKDLK